MLFLVGGGTGCPNNFGIGILASFNDWWQFWLSISTGLFWAIFGFFLVLIWLLFYFYAPFFWQLFQIYFFLFDYNSCFAILATFDKTWRFWLLSYFVATLVTNFCVIPFWLLLIIVGDFGYFLFCCHFGY